MSINSFGHLYRVTTWGESHGPALGATIDGCPPGVPRAAAPWGRSCASPKGGSSRAMVGGPAVRRALRSAHTCRLGLGLGLGLGF